MRIALLLFLAVLIAGCETPVVNKKQDVKPEDKPEFQKFKLEYYLEDYMARHTGWNNNDLTRKDFAGKLDSDFYRNIAAGTKMLENIPLKMTGVQRQENGNNFAAFEYDTKYIGGGIDIDLKILAECNDSLILTLDERSHYFLKSFKLFSYKPSVLADVFNMPGFTGMGECHLGILEVTDIIVQKAP